MASLSTHPKPVAFVDRDGTIVRDYPDEQWASVSVPEFVPGALSGLGRLAAMGFGIVVVTNQYTIGEGIITPLDYLEFSSQVVSRVRKAKIPLVDVLHCPHARSVECSCRKPEIGMGLDALARHPSLTLTGGVVIGDAPTDMAFAGALGLRGYLLANDLAPSSAASRSASSWESVVQSIEARRLR